MSPVTRTLAEPQNPFELGIVPLSNNEIAANAKPQIRKLPITKRALQTNQTTGRRNDTSQATNGNQIGLSTLQMKTARDKANRAPKLSPSSRSFILSPRTT